MITRPTVLVLGAGASAPYGFPTGGEILNQLRDMPDQWRNPIAPECGWAREVHDALIEFLYNSGVFSIDAIAGHRKDIEPYAKGATAYLVSRQEKERPVLQAGKQSDWLKYLHNLMFTTPSGTDPLRPVPLKVITYNHDRSFEFATVRRATTIYGSAENAKLKLSQMRVLHVHGSIGPLKHWDTAEPHIPFDSPMNSALIKTVWPRIKFIHEQNENSPEFREAQDILQWAHVVIFLGCGMHEENVKRLRPEIWTVDQNRPPRVFVCAKDLTRGTVLKAKNLLGSVRGVQVLDTGLDALGALHELEHEFS